MDLGLSAEAGEAAPAVKKQAVGASRDDTRKILTLLAECSLSNSLQARLMRAIMLDCTRCPSDNQYVLEASKATQAHHSRAQDFRKEGRSPDYIRDQLGTPSIHVWNACIKVYRERRQEAKDEEAVKWVEGYIKEWEARGVAGQTPFVRHFAKERMFDKTVVRLVSCVRDSAAAQATHTPFAMYQRVMADLLSMPGVKALPGITPKGDLEQQIQAWLDQNGAPGR